jgi:hypothetical protein
MTAPSSPAKADDTLDILPPSLKYFDAAIIVFDPQHGDIFDPIALVLGKRKKLGVKEPGLVFNLGNDRLDSPAAHCLEAALGVAEAYRQSYFQQKVVDSRNDLTL